MTDSMEPSLQNILDQKSLKWIFVGGKGGVGKTTTSCSLAIQLSKVRPSVLLISTDPAHNLSDAFSQKFGKEATLVNGFDNLYAMEIDPSSTMEDLAAESAANAAKGDASRQMEDANPLSSLFNSGIMNELSSSIPGVDEAMGFAHIMKLVKSLEFSVIVFDTAPTGHTLRFLNFPRVMEKALGKLVDMSGRFGGMLQQVSGMMGIDMNHQEAFAKVNDMKQTVEEVHRQFTNKDKTTFVCVCISEFLSLYETERMIQELQSFKIDTHNIVVNQLLFPKIKSKDCDHCQARRRMQQKYLTQILDLYDDMHIIQLPLLTKEVRGVSDLTAFSEHLVQPFVPSE